MASIIADLYGDDKMRQEYSNVSKYDMPMHDEIDPAKKNTQEYCLQVVKAGFSSLMRDRSALPGSAYQYMQLLRDYGSGNQNEDYYLNLFKKNYPKNTPNPAAVGSDVDGNWNATKEAERQGLGNVNTKIVSVMTNLKSAIQGIASTAIEDVYVNSTDSGSVEAEEKRMYSALFDAENMDFIKGMKDQFGIDLATDEQFPSDVTLEELKVYKDMGGFRSEWAIAMEQLVGYTLRKSDWKMNIKRKWVDDAIDLNIMAGRAIYDSETCEERFAYVDPENVTSQWSIEQNFTDSEYKGYFTLEKMSKLVQKGFDKKDLLKAAKRFEYFFGNYRGVNWKNIEGSGIFDEKLQNYYIPVYHYYWIDCDVKRQLKTTTKYRTVINDIDFDSEVKPLSDYRKKQGVEQEEIGTRIRKGYQISWIVDSDMAYDWGMIPNQARKSKKKEPVLPIFIWRGVNTDRNQLFGSITESIIPFLDNLQLAWLKYQDALIKSNPGGYLINLRLLQNLEIDGRKISPLDAFEMFFKTGRMPYMDTPIGENYKGGAVLPMSRIEGDLGSLMAVTSNEIHFNLSMIEKMTGINPGPLGQPQATDQSVTATKMAAVGTNNVIRPYFEAIFYLKEQLCDFAAMRIQLLIRNNEQSRKSYAMIVGQRSVDMLKDMERVGADYGMYMEARPDQAEVQELLMSAQEALSPGRDGKIQINLSQYMYLVEQIRSGGNLKKLTRDLSFLIRRNEQEQQKIAQANIQAQTQAQQQMKQAEAQMDQMKQQGKAQADIMVDNNRAKNEERQRNIDAMLEHRKMIHQTKLDILKDAEQRKQQPELSTG